jgi:glycine/D-amino acid oxidase-like deaminating enzyme
LKFLVIGGGISGLFLSYYLLKSGHEVIVADAGRRGSVKTSAYNAGQLSPRSSFTEIIPSDAVRLSAREVQRNHGWFGLARGQSRERYDEVTAALSVRSLALYQRFFSAEKARVDVIEEVLDLHSVLPAEGPAGKPGARFITPAELSELGYRGFAGGWLREERSLHSGKLLSHLRSRISDMGAEAAEGEVRLRDGSSRISCAIVNGEEVVADAYVGAGGAWSRAVCRPLRYDPMVIPARGLVLLYRTGGEQVIDYPANYADEKVTVTQHDGDTVRLTGFCELVGFNPRFSRPRMNQLFEAVTSHLSRPCRLELSEVGVGYRPFTPDQLPVVGRIPRCENGYVLTGSCRKGMVLAPALSQLLIGCVFDAGETDDPALQALDPGRFQERGSR